MNQIPEIFDRALLKLRRRRIATRAAQGDFLHGRIARELAERVSLISRHFDIAADLGTHTGRLAAALGKTENVGQVIATDNCQDYLTGEPGLQILADEEWLPFRANSLDLVASNLQLQWANDLPGIFAQAQRALKPDGLFLAVLFGGQTLHELRAALGQAEIDVTGGLSPRVAPMAEIRDLGALLQRAGFSLPVADILPLNTSYATPLHLMRELRAMGEQNALQARVPHFTRRAVIDRAVDHYAANFADSDGRVRATYELIFLSGWAPDANQPQPLRPGSAQSRLAEALGTTETPLKD